MIALLSHRSLENSKRYSFSYSALFSVKVALMFLSMELKELGSSRYEMTRMPGKSAKTNQPSSTPASSLLVADDNSMNRIMLSRYLTKLGY